MNVIFSKVALEGFSLSFSIVAFEITQSGAWVDGGVEHAKRQAENTLREKGWDTARKALAITVRYVSYISGYLVIDLSRMCRSCFMRAFLEEGARRNARVATQFYGSALTLLEWGQTKWRDVSRDDRGAIFENTFVRGVRRYYLSAYLMVSLDCSLQTFPMSSLYCFSFH